jgi:hypothetical protein
MRLFAIFDVLWDVSKMSTVYQQHKRLALGIVVTTLGLGGVYFVRRFGGSKLKQFSVYGVEARREGVVVVSSFKACEIAAENLQRLVVLCRVDQLLDVGFTVILLAMLNEFRLISVDLYSPMYT